MKNLNLKNVLKKLMKQKELRYRDLALELGVSEVTVKRIMSREDFSLDRLSKIADWLELSLSELFELCEKDLPRVLSFSLEQEEFLAKHTRHFLFYHGIFSGLSRNEVQKKFRFSESEAEKISFDLDRVELIELAPKNRIRVLHRGPIQLRKGGVLDQKLGKKAPRVIFEELANRIDKQVLFRAFEMTLLPESFQEFKSSITDLIERHRAIAIKQIRTHKHSELIHYSGVLALGDFYPWEKILAK